MKKILINLKDWLNLKENELFRKEIDHFNITVFPSLPYLYIYKDIRDLGVQDISSLESGSNTGSVSIEHLKDFNVSWALLNHNENRTENKDELLSKIKCAIKANLNIVLCINSINAKELDILKNIFDNINNYQKLYIAYEPIDEIPIDQTIKDIDKLKKFLSKYSKCSILYGGNINEDNIEVYNKSIDVEGYLISRSALDIKSLKAIIGKIE